MVLDLAALFVLNFGRIQHL